MKKRLYTLITAALVTAMLTGCGGGIATKSADSAANFYSMDMSAPEAYASDGWYSEEADYYDDYKEAPYSETNGTDGASNTANSTSAETTGRKLIKRVSMNVQTLEYDKGCSMLEAFVAQSGGYIESSSSSNYSYYSDRKSRYANYTVRIPSAGLDGFLKALGGIGTIYNQSMSTEDVTLSYLDIEARSKSLKIQQERLLDLLAKAETIEEIISLEDRISEVTYQLEAKESTLKNYDNLVTYSTVTISIEEVSHITEVEPQTVGERIKSGLSDTFYTISEGFKNFSVWFVVNLPFIVLWLVIIAVLVVLIRLIVKVWKAGKAKRLEKKQARKAAADAKKQAALQAAWAKKQAEQNNSANK